MSISFIFIAISDLLPISSIKIPKLKKIRQWSHDRISDLGQATGISSTLADYKEKKRRSLDETQRHFPTNGISTISSAIRDHQMNPPLPPKRDNYGLYALKQDRSLSFESAKRGILMSIPSSSSNANITTRVHTRADVHQSFHSAERNHEVFQSCEKLGVTSTEMMHGGTQSTSFPPNNSDASSKIEPPPRKKKRQTATKQILKHSKPPKVPIIKRAESNFELMAANDSDVFRIVNTNTEKAKVMIEEPRRGSVTMVKPKVGRAERVRFQTEKPVVAKVKSYEWQKHQRKASLGSMKPPVPIIKLSSSNKKYQYQPSDSSSSVHSDKSIDIFQSNRLKDQQKLFDEFDELFKKNKDSSENEPPTAETALRKLRELKKSTSGNKTSFDDDMRTSGMSTKTFPTNLSPEVGQKLPSHHQQANKALERVDEVSTKPKIVYEQPKAMSGVMKKKIIYYDDENEMRQLIMNQTQTTTIIKKQHFESNFTSKSEDISSIFKNLQNVHEGKMPISSIVSATGASQREFETHYDAVDISSHQLVKQQHQQIDVNANSGSVGTGNANNLRIFSNEGIFVFNL